MNDQIELVYRPKTEAERARRIARANALVGTPFVHIPGRVPHEVAFESSAGQKVRIGDVEMVYNDALLMDAISDWGIDGPLCKDTYRDTEGGRLMAEIYQFACEAYKDADIPPQLKRRLT